MIRIGFIGAGKAGTGLAALLNKKKKYQVVIVYDINQEAIKKFVEVIGNCHVARDYQEVADMAELVFITTYDHSIRPACSKIKWRAGQSVIHCSGANSSDLLESAGKQGAYVGVFHPGFLFATQKQTIESLPGTTFDIEAEEPLLTKLKDMASALDCQWIEVGAKERGVFHFAEELATMYILFMLKMSTNLMKSINIPQDKAMEVLLPMLKATVNQIETIGIAQHLAGPVARYDIESIKKHIGSLEKIAPAVVSFYRELAFQSIPVVLEQGSINQQQAEELKNLLK